MRCECCATVRAWYHAHVDPDGRGDQAPREREALRVALARGLIRDLGLDITSEELVAIARRSWRAARGR